MKKTTLLLAFLLTGNFLAAQRTCETPEPTFEDLNSIKKCPVEKKSTFKKATRKLTFKPSALDKRFLTIRKNVSISSSLNNSKSKNISTTNQTLSKPLTTNHLKKEKALVASSLHKISSKGISNVATTNKTSLASLATIKKEYTSIIYNFSTVDKIPAFNSCVDLTGAQNQHICFNSQMTNFIVDNMEYIDAAVDENMIGKIVVNFVIGSDGIPSNINVSGIKKAQALKEAVIKLITKLPKFSPAQKNNLAVPVSYEFALNLSF